MAKIQIYTTINMKNVFNILCGKKIDLSLIKT